MPLRTKQPDETIDEDPILALNRAHARLSPNAADHYQRALAAFAPPPNQDRYLEPGLHEVSRGTLPEWAADWVFVNAATIQRLSAASRAERCWFDLAWARYAGRLYPISHKHSSRISTLRSLGILCCVAARLAADRDDWPAFTRIMFIVDRLGRHMLQQATLFDLMIGVTARAQVHFMVYETLCRMAEADVGRRLLATNLAPLAEPLPNISHLWRNELALDRWSIRRSPRRSIRSWFENRAREERESNEKYRLVLAWIEQPIHDACDPDNAARRALLNRIPKTELTLHVPKRREKTIAFPDGRVESVITFKATDRIRVDDWMLCRPFELYVKATAMRAGLVTLLRVFAHRERTGDWPASLDELAPAPPNDPFTGRPMIYRMTADGFTLYSAGWNRRDDGGDHRWDFGEESPGDFVFWPPQDVSPGPTDGSD